MPEQKPVKHLVIELQFHTITELDDALKVIKQQVKLGVEEYKNVRDGVRYEYGLCYLQEFDCRIEIINGEEHFIIPSKINK